MFSPDPLVLVDLRVPVDDLFGVLDENNDISQHCFRYHMAPQYQVDGVDIRMQKSWEEG